MINHSSLVNPRVVAVLVWLVATSGVTGATYHVAPGGKDSNAGSASAPWATLQHAAGKVAAGDTVFVKAGKYAGFDLRTAGAKGKPITFRGEKGAVINARNPRTADGINLEGSGHVVIDGLAVEKAPRAGVRVVNSPGVVVRNNSIDGCGVWGILTGFANDVLIENNVTSRSVKEHGIYVGNTCRGPVVRGNTSWGNAGCGIHLNGDKEAGGEGIITKAIIENNTIYENGKRTGSGINGDGVQDSLIQNNLLYNNHASGISLYRVVGGGPSKNNRVINNTVVMATDGRWALNIMNGSTGNRVVNNILLTRHSFRGSLHISPDSFEGLRSDSNVLTDRFSTDGGETNFQLANWQSDHGQDKHSIVALPVDVFKDIDSNDYRLSPSSPAVDAGTADLAPKRDREGNPRPRGKGVDIGAHESAETAATVPPVKKPSTPPDKPGSDPAPGKSEQPPAGKSSPAQGEKESAKGPVRADTAPANSGLSWGMVILLVVGVIAVFASGVGLALLIQRQSATGRRRTGRRPRAEPDDWLDKREQAAGSDRERRRSRDRR